MKLNHPVFVSSTSFSSNEILRAELCEIFSNVTFNKDSILTPKALSEALLGKEGLIFGLDEINKELLKAHPQLSVVSKFGVGLDNVDLEACEKLNVKVGWTPGTNKKDVAEHALALILGISRNIFEKNHELKKTLWKKNGGKALSEISVGIVGLGNIGKELAKTLRHFGTEVFVHDLVYDEAFCREYDLKTRTKEELLASSDIVTLHIPLNEKTHHYISEKEFSLMKKTAWVINTSRGKNIDSASLKKALAKGMISGAALDVFEEEPCKDTELLNYPNLIVTPHTAGNSQRAIMAMGRSSIEHLKKHFEGQNK